MKFLEAIEAIGLKFYSHNKSGKSSYKAHKLLFRICYILRTCKELIRALKRVLIIIYMW
jgi:hypothetical protein